MYYSEISKSEVTEPEAVKQIIDLCSRWYQIAQPKYSFGKYIKKHPEFLDIEYWPYFEKLEQ